MKKMEIPDNHVHHSDQEEGGPQRWPQRLPAEQGVPIRDHDRYAIEVFD